MLVSPPPGKRLNLQRLATTPLRENAYYVPYDDGTSDRTIVSGSGEDWEPCFLENGRVTVFLAGGPGSGKSYFASQILESLPRKAQILLLTGLTEPDAHFTEFEKEKRLWRPSPLTQEKLKRMTLDNLRGAAEIPVLLFDDVDKISDDKVRKAVYALLEDALANGRGHKKQNGEGDIHVIYTGHSLNDFLKTKYVTENCDYVIAFPSGTTFMQYKQLMKKLGIEGDLVTDSFNWGKGRRWGSVIVKKTVPMYMIFGDTITLI